jgi:hypothetical protein
MSAVVSNPNKWGPKPGQLEAVRISTAGETRRRRD